MLITNDRHSENDDITKKSNKKDKPSISRTSDKLVETRPRNDSIST